MIIMEIHQNHGIHSFFDPQSLTVDREIPRTQGPPSSIFSSTFLMLVRTCATSKLRAIPRKRVAPSMNLGWRVGTHKYG